VNGKKAGGGKGSQKKEKYTSYYRSIPPRFILDPVAITSNTLPTDGAVNERADAPPSKFVHLIWTTGITSDCFCTLSTKLGDTII
jgi:hypothetical protein